MIDCDCPRCGSRNTKAFSVLHHDGTKDSAYRRQGWLYFRRSVGVYGSVTRGRAQTLTAQRATPPVPAATRFLRGAGVPVLLLAGTAIGGVPGFLFALALLIVVAVKAGNADAKQYGERLAEWSSTFRCNRCGTVFAVITPTEDSGAPASCEHSA